MIVIHPDLSWFDGSDQPCRNNCTENTEILSSIVISQAVMPELAVTYGGIPHIMDMRTAMISFG